MLRKIQTVLPILIMIMLLCSGCSGSNVWEVPSGNASSNKNSIVEKNKMLWNSSASSTDAAAASSSVKVLTESGKSSGNVVSSVTSVTSSVSSDKVSSKVSSFGRNTSSESGKTVSRLSSGSAKGSLSKSVSSKTANSSVKTTYNTADKAGNMVWIPQSGSKYHKNAGCSKMKSPTKVTRAKAESMGYTPCKRCYK